MCRTQPGFTLIELLVVVAIVAILLGAGAMSLRPQEGQRLHMEAQKLRQWLDVTCDLALFRHTVVAVVPNERGLKGFIWQGKAWRPLQQPFNWSADMEAQWQGAKAKWPVVSPLPTPGWLCWPDGTRSQGQLLLQRAGQQQALSLQPAEHTP